MYSYQIVKLRCDDWMEEFVEIYFQSGEVKTFIGSHNITDIDLWIDIMKESKDKRELNYSQSLSYAREELIFSGVSSSEKYLDL